jgi:hypothetical protein
MWKLLSIVTVAVDSLDMEFYGEAHIVNRCGVNATVPY